MRRGVPIVMLLVMGAAAGCSQRGAVTPMGRRAPGSAPAMPVSPIGTAPWYPATVVERMVWSQTLQRSVRVLIYLPAGYEATGQRYPTIYLLHGTPGTPDAMFAQLGLKQHLDQLIHSHAMPPALVVVPTGGPDPFSDTEWADSAVDPTQTWGSFVWEDLVGWIDANLRTIPDRGHRALAGLSMGGFGALNLALRHRDVFGSASVWSGYFIPNTPEVEGDPGSPAWLRDSPMDYIPALQPSLGAESLRLSFYVGSDDPFYAENVAFDQLLTARAIPHRFAALPGGHTWSLWRGQLDDEFRWMGEGFAKGSAG